MRYVLLLYATSDEPAAPCDGRRALVRDLAGQSLALAGTGSATTVRVRGGRMLLCDGAVTEHGEQLHGLLVIDVRNLDEAIAVASKIPTTWFGAVEVRPVRDL